jgi:murein DD-endopeptidase MepM/ murein hydrolase activator NlpD
MPLCRSLLHSLLPLTLALAPLAPMAPLAGVARAETVTAPPAAVVEHTRAQRIISDDPLLDQSLVAASVTSAPLPPRFDPRWPTIGIITTYFGEVGPLSPRGHTGLDVAAPQGTPIYAADAGEIIKANFTDDGYGGLIIIAHPSGYETWYAHLSRFDVSKGQKVKRGDQIALMGSTGYSTGPHLHFEVHEEGQLRDPLNFLKESALQPARF